MRRFVFRGGERVLRKEERALFVFRGRSFRAVPGTLVREKEREKEGGIIVGADTFSTFEKRNERYARRQKKTKKKEEKSDFLFV